MSVQPFATFIAASYILLAGVTWTLSDNRASILGRLTLADGVGLVAIMFWVALLIQKGGRRAHLPYTFRMYVPLLFVFLAGVAFAQNQLHGIFEWFVHAFSFVVSLAVYNFLLGRDSRQSVERALKIVLYSGSALAILALVDFIIFPGLLPGITYALVGTFRNTGQAGAFFGTYLALLIPGFLTGLIPRSAVNVLLLSTILLALAFTFKRAAALGTVIGFTALSLTLLISRSRREKRYGAVLAGGLFLAVPLLVAAFAWSMGNIDGMSHWFLRKFSVEAVEGFADGFFMDNVRTALAGFQHNPAIGTGLGNVVGTVSDRYEVHSTYMAVIATGGLSAVLAYGAFMGYFIISLLRSTGDTVYGAYIRYFLPFLLGLMASWMYTYHLRKREFWILMLIVTIISRASRVAESETRAGSIERASVT